MAKFVECVRLEDNGANSREKVLLNTDFVTKIMVQKDYNHEYHSNDHMERMGWDVLLTASMAVAEYKMDYVYFSCSDEATAIKEMKKLAEYLSN